MRRSLLGLALLCGGCLMPHGRPVIVEARTGHYWNGEGVLLEVSDDHQSCRVALRTSGWIWVEKKWVPCQYVHAPSSR